MRSQVQNAARTSLSASKRLDKLIGHPVQRIGLSATVNPVEEVARFLGGSQPVTVVNPGAVPAMDLKAVEPLRNMLDTSATGGSVWPVIERSILDEVLRHRTTLIFVNSRGLAEKLTARLNDMYAESKQGTVATDLSEHRDLGSPEGREQFAGHYDSVVGSTTMLVESHEDIDAIAMAHHGSVSKDRRKQIEEQLKRGELRCVVATSSLELGIDMGFGGSRGSGGRPIVDRIGIAASGPCRPQCRRSLARVVLPHNPPTDYWRNNQHGMHEGRGYRTIAYAPQPSGRARTADRRSRGHGRSFHERLVRACASFRTFPKSRPVYVRRCHRHDDGRLQQ